MQQDGASQSLRPPRLPVWLRTKGRRHMTPRVLGAAQDGQQDDPGQTIPRYRQPTWLRWLRPSETSWSSLERGTLPSVHHLTSRQIRPAFQSSRWRQRLANFTGTELKQLVGAALGKGVTQSRHHGLVQARRFGAQRAEQTALGCEAQAEVNHVGAAATRKSSARKSAPQDPPAAVRPGPNRGAGHLPCRLLVIKSASHSSHDSDEKL